MNARTIAIAVLALAALAAGGLVSCADNTEPAPTVRIVLEPEEGTDTQDLDQRLDGARAVIEARITAFELSAGSVEREGEDRIVVEVASISRDEAIAKIGRTGLLQFCEPVTDEAGNVAIVRQGTVQYLPQTCEPNLDAEGDIVVDGGSVEFAPWPPEAAPQAYTDDQMVWQPAAAKLDGVKQELTGHFLEPNTFVQLHQATDEPVLGFEWTEDGADISLAVTERLAEHTYPLALFLDGAPVLSEDGTIIAPRIQSPIGDQGGQITGLTLEGAEDLSKLLNTGVLPIALRVVSAEDIS